MRINSETAVDLNNRLQKQPLLSFASVDLSELPEDVISLQSKRLADIAHEGPVLAGGLTSISTRC
jgi:hypothetical protein